MIAFTQITNWPQAFVVAAMLVCGCIAFVAFCIPLNGSNFPWDRK